MSINPQLDFDFLKLKGQARIDWSAWRVVIADRLAHAATHPIKHLTELPSNEETCIIVGSGPSVKRHLGEIRTLYANGNRIVTINQMHEFLLKNDITPTMHVLFENDNIDAENFLGGRPNRNVTYYICSSISQRAFFELSGYHNVLWHYYGDSPEYQRLIGKLFPGEFMIGGAYNTFFRTLNIMLTLGYRKFELFGCDSSFEGSSDHIEGYLQANHNLIKYKTVSVRHPKTGELREFRTSDSLISQVYEFMKFCASNQAFIKLRVHGNSLLRYMHEDAYPGQYNEEINDEVGRSNNRTRTEAR